MNRQMKMISMILVIGLMVGSLMGIKVEAKQVEVKKQEIPNVKVVFLNDGIDENVEELVFKIKNRTDSKIKVKKIEFQTWQNEEWSSFEKREDAKSGCNISVRAKDKIYDSILLKKDYIVPESGLPTGKYAVSVKYKYKGNYYYARKTFKIVREDAIDNETNVIPTKEGTVDNVSNQTPPKEIPIAVSVDASETAYTFRGAKVTGDSEEILLLNWDFSTDKKGNCRAMVFSEAYFQKTDKVKITLKVQKKNGGKWRKCKKIKVTKKSNIAFVNKSFRMKKKGTYRMNVKIEFYKDGIRQGGYRVKTKSQKF